MSASGQGQGEVLEQTWYFKPPKARFDMAAGTGGDTGRISMFMLENGTFLCTEGGGEKSCLKTSAEAAAAQNAGFDLQDDFRNDPAAFNATLRETRTLAGEQAFCYLVRGAQTLGFTEGTFCYSRTGIPLLLEWGASGASFKMEATSFSTNVPDSDFQLPAPPLGP